MQFKEIKEELSLVLKGKTIDALFPPLVFVILNALVSLNIAIIGALSFGLFIVIFRVLKTQVLSYALFGLGGVIVASLFAYFLGDANDYFLPSVISTGFLMVVAIVSIILKKPLAALLSHLTRNFPLDWYNRKDVLPAYMEVTYAWTVLIISRFVIQLTMYLSSDVTQLAWINTITGLPATIVVLIGTYVYGMWRLKQLKGPGVDEFLENKEPPFKGQTRGF